MNNDAIIAKMVKAVPELVTDHLKDMMPKMEKAKEATINEVSLLNEFINALVEIGENFEKTVFGVSETFQLQVKERVKDEKLGQFYQLVVNNLLKFADEVQHTFFNFKGYGEVVQSYVTDHENIFKSIESSVNLNAEALELKIKENDRCLFEQTDYYKDHRNDILSFGDNDNKKKLYELEERRHRVCEDTFIMMNHNVDLVVTKLKDVVKFETAMKNSMRDLSTKMIQDLMGNRNKEVLQPIKDLDNNLERFRCHSDFVYKEANLIFSEFTDVYKYSRIFYDFESIKRLNSLLENKYNRYIYKKTNELGGKLTTREKLFIEIFLESLYCGSTSLDERTIRKIDTFLTNINARSYLLFNLILKKSQFMLEKPFDVVIIDTGRFQNFEVLVKQLLNFDLRRKKIDLEMVYHLMKFCINIFDTDYTNLLKLYRFCVIFNSMDFWTDLLVFFKGYLKPKQAEDGEIITLDEEVEKEQVQKRFQFITINFKAIKQKSGHSPAELAMENILYLSVHCGLDFDKLVEIIVKIGPLVDLPFQRLKNAIKKKKALFLASLDSLEAIRRANRYRNENYAHSSHQDKIYLVFKHALPFMNYKDDLVSVISLNKKFYQKRLKLYNSLLLRADLKDNNQRIFLYDKSLNIKIIKTSLKEEFPKTEIDPLINLDMKRTACEEGLTDQLRMEDVLKNVCHPSGANFSYYQGLNYITRYFYLMYNKDCVATYNIVSTLMVDHFSIYFDSKFKNLRKLFFMLKVIIRMHLPSLYNFLMHIHKLDLEIVFTAWCLTLFTPLTQYNRKSYLLDEIIDIFISKGWAGFFRVVLVIMEEYQDRIYGAQYDQILIIFSNLLKNGFSDLFTHHETLQNRQSDSFSFKVAITKYKSINKKLLSALSDEYVNALQTLDKVVEGLNDQGHKN